MAWLAWLLLALAPVHGMPRGTMGDVLQGTPASSIAHVADHGQHAMPAPTDCCGDQAHDRHRSMGPAHCAAMCGSILPAVAMAGLVPVAPEPLRLSPSFAPAPGIVHAVPLRPPVG
ncbi:hypothetical protein DEO45_07510 [Rhodanobacter denitrificans]|uniref:DUF2946 domain-containing protein n=2 Tax=Rhodanobacter denitrificans TaxID=666685 RepID=A0A368KFF7_9GAMM|nr:hypothetical protein DEO45_07510 [Rhodanobacter denitrificans]